MDPDVSVQSDVRTQFSYDELSNAATLIWREFDTWHRFYGYNTIFLVGKGDPPPYATILQKLLRPLVPEDVRICYVEDGEIERLAELGDHALGRSYKLTVPGGIHDILDHFSTHLLSHIERMVHATTPRRFSSV